jgi:hypothetical protein
MKLCLYYSCVSITSVSRCLLLLLRVFSLEFSFFPQVNFVKFYISIAV